MKLIKYTLFPEAYASNGIFIDKEGYVGELIVDVRLLINSNFDKIIPEIDILKLLKKIILLFLIINQNMLIYSNYQ